MTLNFSLICQIRDFGSGQILQPRQLYRSPGLAKIAPWWLARRDYFPAKVPGLCDPDKSVMSRQIIAIYQDYSILRFQFWNKCESSIGTN